MSSVTVSILSPLTDSLGLGSVTREITVEIQPGKTTIAAVLTDLVAKYDKFRRFVFDPQSRKLTALVVLFLNRQRVDDSAIDTFLKDGDELTLVPPVLGG